MISTTPVHGQTFRRKDGDLDRVGVAGLRVPITVLDKKKKTQATVATLSLSVNVPHRLDGGHIAGFMKILKQRKGEFTMRTLPLVLKELQHAFSSESAYVRADFPYFIEGKFASKELAAFDCTFIAEANGERDDFILGVKVPLRIESKPGAGGARRAMLAVQVRSSRDKKGKPGLIWIEELIAFAEKAVAKPKPGTAQADGFFSSTLRSASEALKKDPRVSWFKIVLEDQAEANQLASYAQTEWWSNAWAQ